MKKIACLVLAAGSGKRFGGKKQLALIDGQPMLIKVIKELRSIFKDDIVVVLGAYRSEIFPLVTKLAKSVENIEWKKGLGSSISIGVKFVREEADYDAVLVTLADQVGLQTNNFLQLIAAYDKQHIVATDYGASFGVPALFPKSYFDVLEQLDAGNGAKSLLNSGENPVIGVWIQNAKIDIDTADDLKNFLQK